MMHNAPKALAKSAPEVIPSLMIPLANRILLAPTVSVAEMVAYTQPKAVPGSPDWLLGEVTWRDLNVPLLSFEVLNGERLPAIQLKSRIAVFNYTGLSEDLPFIAIATQGIPKLARVNADDISLTADVIPKPFDRLHVTLSGEDLIIPDVTALERAYLDWWATKV